MHCTNVELCQKPLAKAGGALCGRQKPKVSERIQESLILDVLSALNNTLAQSSYFSS